MKKAQFLAVFGTNGNPSYTCQPLESNHIGDALFEINKIAHEDGQLNQEDYYNVEVYEKVGNVWLPVLNSMADKNNWHDSIFDRWTPLRSDSGLKIIKIIFERFANRWRFEFENGWILG